MKHTQEKKTGKQNDHYNSNWLKALKKKKTKLLWEQIQTGKSMFKKILHQLRSDNLLKTITGILKHLLADMWKHRHM